MAEITNLTSARKARARAEKRAAGAANAARHGRSKAERLLEAARSEKARAMLDQHRLEEDENDTGPNGA